MKRSLPSLLVIGLLSALLASCGSSTSVQQTVATPATSSHGHNGRIAWEGFLDQNLTVSAIFSANADGSNIHQLSHPSNEYKDVSPDWSPDGSKIIFVRGYSDQDGGDLYIMKADGTGLNLIDDCTDSCLGIGEGAWSPDGTQIAYSRAGGYARPDGNPIIEAIWVMQADSSHSVQLTHPLLNFADRQPSWSPDGKQVVFGRSPIADVTGDQVLFIVNRDGTGLKQLTSWGQLKAGDAHWSPDGQRILFQSFGNHPAGSTPQIYTILPDGTHLVQLTTNERNTYPAWSPDGTKIIFAHRSTTEDSYGHIYQMNPDGSGLVQVTKNGLWQIAPAWGTHP
jgi:TolB protein